MTQLDDQTLGAPAAGITFSAIAQTYNHLMIVVNARSAKVAVNDWLFLRLNGDTGANYLAEYTAGSAAAASAGESLAAATVAFFIVPGASATADHYGAAKLTVPNYRSAVRKSACADFFSSQATTTGGLFGGASGQLWMNVAAITSITVMSFTGATNLAAGSRATLYGLT